MVKGQNNVHAGRGTRGNPQHPVKKKTRALSRKQGPKKDFITAFSYQYKANMEESCVINILSLAFFVKLSLFQRERDPFSELCTIKANTTPTVPLPGISPPTIDSVITGNYIEMELSTATPTALRAVVRFARGNYISERVVLSP